MLQPLKIIHNYKNHYEEDTEDVQVNSFQYAMAIIILIVNIVCFILAFIFIFKYGFCMKSKSQTSNVCTIFGLCILNMIFPYPYTCIGSLIIIWIVYVQKQGKVCYSEWRFK